LCMHLADMFVYYLSEEPGTKLLGTICHARYAVPCCVWCCQGHKLLRSA
jgi:hypothetical protein